MCPEWFSIDYVFKSIRKNGSTLQLMVQKSESHVQLRLNGLFTVSGMHFTSLVQNINYFDSSDLSYYTIHWTELFKMQFLFYLWKHGDKSRHHYQHFIETEIETSSCNLRNGWSLDELFNTDYLKIQSHFLQSLSEKNTNKIKIKTLFLPCPTEWRLSLMIHSC